MDESNLRVDQRVRRSMRDVVREALVTGLAVVVPVIITAIVLATALQYVHGYLAIVAEASTLAGNEILVPVWGEVRLGTLLVEVLTPVVLLGVIFVVGLFVSTTHVGERAVDYFDGFISRIPAVGGIYESFRQMSDVVLESDVRNFRDVKLVEFPTDDTYTLGFVTTETPARLADPVGDSDMLTLFLPLAPNPVMGGHLVHVHRKKVVDVDMTVEEGLRTIVTSGVAVADEGGRDGASLSGERLRDLATGEHAERQFDPGEEDVDARPERDGSPRAAVYDNDVDAADEGDPAAATTPADVARRGGEPHANEVESDGDHAKDET